VLFHGELHNESELRAASGMESVPPGVAALLATMYRRQGSSFGARLKGAFCAALFDPTGGQLLLITDLVGSYPLYWTQRAEGLAFASQLRALVRLPGAASTLDARAIADFLHFGFLLGDKTLAPDVRLVPPGSILTFDRLSGECRIEHQRRIADLFSHGDGDRATYLDRTADTFGQAVARSLSGRHRFGLSLSGGLDSRSILSAVNGQAGSVTTLTLGVKGCADEVIARELATIAGVTNRFRPLDGEYLGDFIPGLRRLVSLTDGMYLTHGLTELAALQLVQDAGVDVLVRGHAGELAKTSLAWPFHTDAQVRAMRHAEELIPYLFDRTRFVATGTTLQDLLTPEWYERVGGGARQSLQESVDDVSLSPADLCTYLYLRETVRRSAIPSLELFRSIVQVRLPFLDEDFLGALFSGPATWRDGTDVTRAIISRYQPALLRVRNSNTGAPADAGPLREAVSDKLNTIFRRLNVYGYRHYHAFGAWMHSMFLPAAERLLLDPETRARGVFREPTLRRLIEDTRSGVANHAYLLQALLILELWQRDHL
jgi:asparagine synthase (glutamine-hydrolysing)